MTAFLFSCQRLRFGANAGARAFAANDGIDHAAAAAPAAMVWSAAPGECSEPRGLRQQPDRNRTDNGVSFRRARALEISGWRDGALYPFGAWVPSAAPDHARSGGYGAADSFLVLSGGGRRGRAMGSASPTPWRLAGGPPPAGGIERSAVKGRSRTTPSGPLTELSTISTDQW